MPEDRQATAIRLAVQDNDTAALERAVRRGANPNARDTSRAPKAHPSSDRAPR